MKKWHVDGKTSNYYARRSDGGESAWFSTSASAQEYVDWQNSKIPPERYYAERSGTFVGSSGMDWQVNIRFGDRDTATRAVNLTEQQAKAVANLLNEMEDSDGS